MVRSLRIVRLYPPTPRQEIFLMSISVRVWVDPRAMMLPEGLCQWKIPVPTSWIEPATFRLVCNPWSDFRLWLTFCAFSGCVIGSYSSWWCPLNAAVGLGRLTQSDTTDEVWWSGGGIHYSMATDTFPYYPTTLAVKDTYGDASSCCNHKCRNGIRAWCLREA